MGRHGTIFLPPRALLVTKSMPHWRRGMMSPPTRPPAFPRPTPNRKNNSRDSKGGRAAAAVGLNDRVDNFDGMEGEDAAEGAGGDPVGTNRRVRREPEDVHVGS